MEINISKKDVLWNYIGTIMTMGSSFLLLPFLMHYLTGDELGLWYVFLSIGGIVTLLDFGFAPTLARNIAYSWSGANELKKEGISTYKSSIGPNKELLKKVVATCKVIYLIISLVALLLLLTLGTLYILFISKGIDSNSYMLAWFIYCIAIFLNIYFGYYTSLLRGVGAIAQLNKANIISRSVQILSSIIFLLLGMGIIGAVTGYLLNGIIYRLLSKYSFYNFNNISLILNNNQKIRLSEIKETIILVWYNAWRDGLVSLSKFLTSQASTIIASLFLTLTETGYYSLSIQLITAIASISGSLYAAYQPALQAAHYNNEKEKSKKIMSKAMVVYTILFFLGILGLLSIGMPILKFIDPKIGINVPVLVVLGLYFYLKEYHSYFASYISNTNRVPYVKSFVVSGILGIVLTILLIKLLNLGIWGLIIGPLIAQALYNNWKWPKFVMDELNTDYFDMLKIGFKELNTEKFNAIKNKKR